MGNGPSVPVPAPVPVPVPVPVPLRKQHKKFKDWDAKRTEKMVNEYIFL